MTLSERLKVTSGRPAGFDYLRISLAVLIVVWHTAITCYGVDAQIALSIGPTRSLWAAILPMFFSLSGFLVSGSLERSRTLVSFLGLRIIRLGPALIVESVIAMLIIGPIFTDLPLGQYFTAPDFWSYTGNMVGRIQFTLPGVFTTNPINHFNGQLWTLPSELHCYEVIAVFAIAGWYRFRTLMVLGCVLAQVYCIYRFTFDPNSIAGGIVQAHELILAFLFGALLFRLRDFVPYSTALFVLSLSFGLIFLSVPVLAPLAFLPAALRHGVARTYKPAAQSSSVKRRLLVWDFPLRVSNSAKRLVSSARLPSLVDQSGNCPANHHRRRFLFVALGREASVGFAPVAEESRAFLDAV